MSRPDRGEQICYFPKSGSKVKAWHKKKHRRALRRVPLDEAVLPNRYHGWTN